MGMIGSTRSTGSISSISSANNVRILTPITARQYEVSSMTSGLTQKLYGSSTALTVLAQYALVFGNEA